MEVLVHQHGGFRRIHHEASHQGLNRLVQTLAQPAREAEDRMLAREIELIYVASIETYGALAMTHWLHQRRFEVSRSRVGRTMRGLGLDGETDQSRVKTTIVG